MTARIDRDQPALAVAPAHRVEHRPRGVLQSHTGSWHAVFVVAAVTNIVVGASALLIVKPLRAARALQPSAVAVPATAK